MYPYPISLFKFMFDLNVMYTTTMQVEIVEKVPEKLGEGIFWQLKMQEPPLHGQKFREKYLESAWPNPGPTIWARCIARTFDTESQK